MTDRNQKLADLLQSWMDEDKAVRAELEALRNVAKWANQLDTYAIEKGDCGACLEWCPNATNGDLNCECGASGLRYALAKWKALTNECDDRMCEVVLDD